MDRCHDMVAVESHELCRIVFYAETFWTESDNISISLKEKEIFNQIFWLTFIMEFSLNAFTEFAEFSDKKILKNKK